MADKFWIYGLIISLLLAGLVSLYASSDPDGLERVAEDIGFLHLGEGEPAVSSPMPDYVIPGIADETLSASLAGIVGTLVMFGIGVGLGMVMRRKSKSAS